MDVHSVSPVGPVTRSRDWGCDVRYATLMVTVLLLFVLALFLLIRRLAGAFDHPPQPAIMLAAAVILSATLMAVRWTGRDVWTSGRNPGFRFALTWTPLAASILCAYSLSLPESQPGVLAFFWGLLMVEEMVSLTIVHRQQPSKPPADPADISESSQQNLTLEPAAGSSVMPDGQIQQQSMRWKTQNGCQWVQGQMRGHFKKDQRTISLHIGFCPPLDSVPQFSAETLEVTNIQLKVGIAETFGARVDLRRSGSAHQPQEVLIQFDARTER